MMPQKGGPSAGTGLHETLVASQASVSASGENPVEQAAAEAAVGTPMSVGVDASMVAKTPVIASTSNPTHIQQSILNPVNRSGASAQEASASAPGAGADASDAPAQDAVAATDVLAIDDATDISMSADYLDLDLAAVPDVTGMEPTVAPFALSSQANAFALHIADSIRNSLMNPHGIQFGGIATLNWSGASANTGSDGKVSGKPLTGFALGFFADIPLQKQLSLRPSLVYSYEGYQPDVNGDPVNIHTAFLSAPIDLVYHTNLFNKRFYIGAGPYAAYALNGTYTLKGINTDMQFGNNYAAGDNLRRMDFGANIMAGVLMDRNFTLGATFDLGLHNIAPSGSATSIRTRSIGLSIGYVFRNRRNAPLTTSAY